ncbi:3244_t:CDS:2, partial [Ambispora leptoticha]
MEEEINKQVEENIKSLLVSGQLFPKTILNMLADFHSNPQTKKAIHHRYLGNQALTNGNYKTAFNEYSSGIINNPDDPALWCNRSLAFLKLGHPELSIIDSRRAIIMIDKFIADYLNNKPGLKMPLLAYGKNENLTPEKKLAQLQVKAMFREIQAFADLKLLPDAIYYCEQLLQDKDIYKDIPLNWIDVQKLLVECKKKLEDGCKKYGPTYKDFVKNGANCTFRGSYWWDSRQENRMSEEIFQILTQKVSEISSSKIEVAKVTFEESGDEYQYGLKATSDISANTLIYEETPFLCVNSKIKKRCDYCNQEITKKFRYMCPRVDCKEIYCNIRCYQQAYDLYHKVMCGKDFSEIYNLVRTGVSTSSLIYLFLIKLFAIGKNRDTCPLDLEEIKHLRRWRSAQQNLPSVSFIFYQIVIKNLEIPIGDLRFDFWVFISCYCFLCNNIFGGKDENSRPDFGSLRPLTSLINHNCESNAFVRNGGLKARRKIVRGEQITISYLDWPGLTNEERSQ